MTSVTTPGGLLIRPVRDDELPAIVEHLQVSFEGWPVVDVSVPPIDHLRWKLGDGWPGEVYNFVGEIDGRMVAVQLHQIWRTKAGDRELLALRGWDAAVHPDVRGRGIMSQMRPAMIRAALPKVHFLFGSSREPAMVTLVRREPRLSFAQPWLALQRPFTIGAALSVFKLRPGRSPRKLARSVATMARWLRPGAHHDAPCTVRTAGRFDSRLDALYERAAAQFDFAVVRSQEVLDWRYADRRAGGFTIRFAEQDGELLGYTVLRVNKGVGYVADVLALPDRVDVVESLARDAADVLRETGVGVAECWLMANHVYVEAFRAAGFLGRRSRTPPTFEAVGIPESELAFLCEPDAAVHLTIGDMDIV